MGRYPHLGALGREGAEDKEAVARALEQCDVTELSRRDVTTLSGGELQRVAIASVLALDPEVLVLGGSIARNEPRITDRIRKVMADTLLYPPRVIDEHFAGRAPLMGALTMAAEHELAPTV